MGRPVSVAMIVKDEAALLGDCLESIRSAADEICVVDTGSRDETAAIARRFGAKIGEFAWCDDFAAARNASLRLCTGDWILVLDADERLTGVDCAKVRMLTSSPADCCYRIVTRTYTNAASVSEFHPCRRGDPLNRGFAGWFPSWKIRLFPNHTGAVYRGKVHELIRPSLEEKGVRVVQSDVVIYHYPFLKNAEQIREKQVLYLRLGREKVRECPTDPNACAELGRQYAEMGDYVGAMSAFREALRHEPDNASLLKDLGGVLHLLGHGPAAEESLRLALKYDPENAEAWRNLGVIYAGREEWGSAVRCFSQAVALDPQWVDGHRYLSLALDKSGRLEEAAQAGRRAVEADPWSEQALSLFVDQMLRLNRRQEVRETLEALARSEEPPPLLVHILRSLAEDDSGLGNRAMSDAEPNPGR